MLYILLSLIASVGSIQIWEFDFCKETSHLGIYSYNKKWDTEIKACKREDTIYIIIHELWHHLRYQYLDDKQREDYSEIVSTWGSGSAPTKYWETSIEEDFAESFAMYMYDFHKKLYKLGDGTTARFNRFDEYLSLSTIWWLWNQWN